MKISNLLLVFIFSLLWGSLLNAVAYRLLYGHSLLKRSFCPQCTQTISWYNLVPFFSWLFLKGRCSSCKKPISWLYPFIELITALSLTALFNSVALYYFPFYSFFFSLLIITIRTDLEAFAILNLISYCIPLGWIGSLFNFLPLSLVESLSASLLGYGSLWLIRFIFLKLKNKEGLGLGDLDLLAFIGAFTGILGIWISVLIGSCTGVITSLFYALLVQNKEVLKQPIPFGPFLALGALLFVLFQNELVTYFFSLL
jgi:leader peptidase (prepilin peptidase) / N-methyltransferase